MANTAKLWTDKTTFRDVLRIAQEPLDLFESSVYAISPCSIA